MPSRSDKERKLRRNVEVNTARAIQYRQEDLNRELSHGEKAEYRQAFEDSARQIDSSGKLAQIWNGPGLTHEQPGKTRGYFGGLSFDENGRIIH